MDTISPAAHLEHLRAIAARCAVPIEDVQIVPSIQAWCEDRGLPETNPFRSGKTVRNNVTGHYLILLAQEITGSTQNSIISAMELRGHIDRTGVLRSPDTFLLHLFLHELAHAQFPEASEDECDEWAFSQLAVNAA